jgi:transcriptional regulator with XRE-family HTH domain
MNNDTDKNKDILEIFGKRVRQFRKEQGLSQEKLAELCCLDRSYLGCVERGEENISLLKIADIAKALDRPVRAFFEF